MMALQIRESYGVTELYGALNTQNMKSLEQHLAQTAKKKEVLILSLDRIDGLDPMAALQLEILYKRAPKNNQVLTIVGKENNLISEVMRETKTDYILSHDRA